MQTRLIGVCGIGAVALLGGCLSSYGQQPGGITSPGVVGGGVDGGGETPDLSGPASMSGSLTVSLGTVTSESLRRNEQKKYMVTVTPAGGFSGVTTFQAAGLPTGATATFDPPGGNISGPTMTTMTLQATSTAAVANAAAIMVRATSGSISAEAPLQLTIAAEVLIWIAPGVDIGAANTNMSAFGAESIIIPYDAGLHTTPTITFINYDGQDHEIHRGSNVNGFGHETGTLSANGANNYQVTIAQQPGSTGEATGTYPFNCHIHGGMVGSIVVQ